MRIVHGAFGLNWQTSVLMPVRGRRAETKSESNGTMVTGRTSYRAVPMFQEIRKGLWGWGTQRGGNGEDALLPGVSKRVLSAYRETVELRSSPREGRRSWGAVLGHRYGNGAANPYPPESKLSTPSTGIRSLRFVTASIIPYWGRKKKGKGEGKREKKFKLNRSVKRCK